MEHGWNKIDHMSTKFLKELYCQNSHKLSFLKSIWHLEADNNSWTHNLPGAGSMWEMFFS